MNTVAKIRGIITSPHLSDEQKIHAVRVALISATPAKKGPYKKIKLTADFAAYLKKYRQDRVAKGVCTCCGGQNTDRIGKALCGACLVSARVTARAKKPLK